MTRQTVLDALREMGRPMTSAGLAAQIGRSPTTISAILSKAAAYGQVTKTPIPGRHNRVYWQAVQQ